MKKIIALMIVYLGVACALGPEDLENPAGASGESTPLIQLPTAPPANPLSLNDEVSLIPYENPAPDQDRLRPCCRTPLWNMLDFSINFVSVACWAYYTKDPWIVFLAFPIAFATIGYIARNISGEAICYNTFRHLMLLSVPFIAIAAGAILGSLLPHQTTITPPPPPTE